MAELARIGEPLDWDLIETTVRDNGGVIVQGLLDEAAVDRLNREVDHHLDRNEGTGNATSGSESYDRFLGTKTIRLHGLIEKLASAPALLGHHELVDFARRLVGPRAASVLLNAAELIQIQPGERAQHPHRDSDSWPGFGPADHPVVVNAIVALDQCTEHNGATHVAPGSWRWHPEVKAGPEHYVRATLEPGDALLFRGDVIHHGGANATDQPRRVVSVSYCAGWLRPVENSFLNVSRSTAAGSSETIRGLLGYETHDGSSLGAGVVGLFENGDPARALDRSGR